jgi:hypothetical protein
MLIDGFHHGYRGSIGCESQGHRAAKTYSGAHDRAEGQRVPEDKGEDDRDGDGRGVTQVEGGRDDHAEDLSDRTADQAVNGRAEG